VKLVQAVPATSVPRQRSSITGGQNEPNLRYLSVRTREEAGGAPVLFLSFPPPPLPALRLSLNAFMREIPQSTAADPPSGERVRGVKAAPHSGPALVPR